MTSLPAPDPHRYIAPPDPYRAARMAQRDREYAIRCRAAAERDCDPIDSGELRSMRADVRRLTDHLADERRAREAERRARDAQIAELSEAIDYLHHQIRRICRGEDEPRGQVA